MVAGSVQLKGVSRDLLGQVVRVLESALDVRDGELLEYLVVVPEPVPLDMKVLGAAGKSVIGR